jgi:hypothetical protein
LITVPLREDEKQALIRLAGWKRRHPREQAAFLLRQELERLGLLESATKVESAPSATRQEEGRHA